MGPRLLPAIVLLALTLGGCPSMLVTSGQRPRLDVLGAELTLGTSTEADARRVLGPPDGRGRSLLPVGASQRPMAMWTYAYVEGWVDVPRMRDMRSAQLYLYFDEGRLQGFMWFSSLPAPASAPR